MSSKVKYIVSISILLGCVTFYISLFYPTQLAEYEGECSITTPQYEKYMDDCLHPCIRRDYSRNGYWLSQSPYYRWNSKTENPIIYHSDDYRAWDNGVLVTDTPQKGYNSDPNIYVSTDTVFIFWRECNTPLCDSLSVNNATVGAFSTDGIHFSSPKVFLTNCSNNSDTEQAPILIRKDNMYQFYATWYQYNPKRKNKGISIWKGTSLTQPNFELTDTLSFGTVLTVDKWLQKKLFNKLIFIPKPLKYDLWHYDLVEYEGKLLMVSSSEKGDNIMLSISKDGKHFSSIQKPLMNSHYMENIVGYRQYYYKPTAIIDNNCLKIFYTTNSIDGNHNVLCMAKFDLKKI